MREVLTTTPEGRAQSFAKSVHKFSTSHFVVEGDHDPGESVAGVSIRHLDMKIFELADVRDIVESLDSGAKKLGGLRVDNFDPIVSGDRFELYGVYQFSAETLLDRGLLE